MDSVTEQAWQTRVRDAISRTATSMREHWFSVLAELTWGGHVQGRNHTCSSEPEDIEDHLATASWEPYESVDDAFTAGIDGVGEVWRLDGLSPDVVVTLDVERSDGSIFATIRDRDRWHKWICFCVVRLADEPGVGEIVTSICIGDIIPPATAMVGGPHGFRGGERVSVRTALAIGVATLKYV